MLIPFAGQDAASSDATGQDWQLRARCRGEDPSVFFGPNRFEPKRERVAREARAKAICAVCPVLVPCRDHALRSGETFGVWGGLGEAERRALIEHDGLSAHAV